MRRRLFAILSASSLMLCIATLGAWVRSYHVSDWVEYVHDHRMEHGRRLIFLNSDCGRLALGTGILDVLHGDLYRGGFTFCHIAPSRRPPAYWDEREGDPDDPSPPPMPPWWTRFGFGVQHDLQNDCSDQITIAAPHWFIVLLTFLLPALCVKRFRLGLGRAQGICKGCGYDLRATPDRCPECGAVPLGKIMNSGGM